MIEKMKLKGHIIDSLTLSKLLDEISETGCMCYASKVIVGRRREDISEAVFFIEENNPEKMKKAVEIAQKHGAVGI